MGTIHIEDKQKLQLFDLDDDMHSILTKAYKKGMLSALEKCKKHTCFGCNKRRDILFCEHCYYIIFKMRIDEIIKFVENIKNFEDPKDEE